MRKINTSIYILSWSVMVWLAASGCTPPRSAGVRLSDYQGSIRVACVGDSITYGSGIDGRESNSYPAVLERRLGSPFQVRNFGVGGATLLRRGDKPYWDQPEFRAIDEYRPHLLIILLGTNDSKPQNWQHRAEFARDYANLIDHFRRLPGRPRIWICLPLPAFETQWGITEATIANEIIPLIKKVADRKHVPLIDLYETFSNRAELFPDKIHPNALGAAHMAKTIDAALMSR